MVKIPGANEGLTAPQLTIDRKSSATRRGVRIAWRRCICLNRKPLNRNIVAEIWMIWLAA